MNHDPQQVLTQIDKYLGTTTTVAAKQGKADLQAKPPAAPRPDAQVLHVMFDIRSKTFVGASVGGKVISGAVAAHLTKDGARLLDAKGGELVGVLNEPPEKVAASAARVQQDIFDWLRGGNDE
jgi:hypothetical protein